MSDHEHHHHDHHDHAHTHDVSTTGDHSLILLSYMYDHNEHHADELYALIANLRAEGKGHTADLVQAALESYRKGNELLHEALHHYSEG